MNDIKDNQKQEEIELEKERIDEKVKGKQVPSRISHRQVNVHGVSQAGSPNVYNLDEGYLLGLASRTHSMSFFVILTISILNQVIYDSFIFYLKELS